jgi:hypothetical protein
MATIEPHANWPGMWRVWFGGKLSDMANLSRAKDAAASMVLRELNADYGKDTTVSGPGGPGLLGAIYAEQYN